MAYFQVKYFSNSGGIVSKTVTAETREQAISLSGVSPGIIHDVSLDHLGGIKSALTDRKFQLVEQVLMLSAMASKLNSGKPFPKAVKESVPYQRLKISFAEIDRCETPKDYLTLLRFDESAILIIDAGDKAGKLSESMVRAAKAIQDRLAAQKEFAKALKQGLLYSTLGLGFMVGIPLFAGGALNDFTGAQRMPIRLNELSHIILFLHTVYTKYSIFILAALVGAFMMRERFWDHVRTLPVFSFINERMKISRGLDFVTSYHIMHMSGFTNPQSFRFLLSRSRGLTHRLYKEAAERSAEGRKLSEVFNNDEWPPILHQNLDGFDEQAPAGREVILQNLSDALKAYYLQYSEKISQVASIVGFTMMIASILMFAVGFYLPIISVQSEIKHM